VESHTPYQPLSRAELAERLNGEGTRTIE